MRLTPDLFSQSEDIRLEPELYEPCKSDISRLCPNVAFGNAQVTGRRWKKRRQIRPGGANACRSLSLPPPSPADDGVPEGAEEAAEPALPPADLQAAGGGDERPRARLPADEGLQADDQGTGEEGMIIIMLIITTIIHFMLKAKLKKRKKDFYWSSATRLQLCVAAKWGFFGN